MPKSYFEMGVWSSSYFRNLSSFITQVWHTKRHEIGDLNETNEDLYADFNGWETITFHVNGDIPFMWVCLKICQKKGIKFKLARYQVKAISELYGFDENTSKADIDRIVSVFSLS
jgi:hypothetical protein